MYGHPQLGRVLLDSGSQLNFAMDSFCSKIGIIRSKSNESVSGVGNCYVSSRFVAIITLTSRIFNFTSTIDVQILSTITQPQPTIGAKLFSDLFIDGQLNFGPNLPTLQNTVLGQVVWGKMSNYYHSNHALLLTCLTSSTDVELKIKSNNSGNQKILRWFLMVS